MELKTSSGQCFSGKSVSEWQLNMIVRRGEKMQFLGIETDSESLQPYMMFVSAKGYYFVATE